MQDEEILRLLLEKILMFPIKKVALVQYQRVMEIDPCAHGIRLDVYADDEAGTRYSVEMQKRNEYNIGKRSRYYLSIMDLDQLEKGVNTTDSKIHLLSSYVFSIRSTGRSRSILLSVNVSKSMIFH